MNVLIIEDELIAARRLKKMLVDLRFDLNLLGVITSVEDAVDFLRKKEPDLILMDIHLADGQCFEIFDRVEVNIPIIFTTAYDQYTLKAFKVNSIDYLLKPIDPDELKAAIRQVRLYKKPALDALLADFKPEQFKVRFLVRSGRSLVSIPVGEVCYVISKNKLSYLVTSDSKKYVADQSLTLLEQMLNPKHFMRVNRNVIVSCRAVLKMQSYFNNRMLLQLDPPTEEDVIVSRNYLSDFRMWMGS